MLFRGVVIYQLLFNGLCFVRPYTLRTMVEETVYSNKPKMPLRAQGSINVAIGVFNNNSKKELLYQEVAQPRAARPRPVFLWNVSDVQKWLRRHCSDYYPLYGEIFQQHDITGRSLIRLNETTLFRLGIHNPDHRQEIWREIIKLRLKTAILEIRDLEHKDM